MGTFIWNNIEIVAALIALAGMGIYYYRKNIKPLDNSNDLTSIAIEHKKLQKKLAERAEGNILGFGNKY